MTSPSTGSLEDATRPSVGTRVVLFYPPEWNKEPRYGQVTSHNEDGTYYITDARLGGLVLCNPENLEMHGAEVRPLLNTKEHRHYDKLVTKLAGEIAAMKAAKKKA